MGQEEVLKYLRKIKKEVDMKNLLINLNQNRSSITRSCRVLLSKGDIKARKMRVKNYTKYFYSI